MKNPDISVIDSKVEQFKTIYKIDFSEKALNKIASEMRIFLLSKMN
jgi:hypothetical protein